MTEDQEARGNAMGPLDRDIVNTLPRAIAIAGCSVDALRDDLLFPVEILAIDNAVLKRKREFIAGRVCARRALARLGVPTTPILVGPQREPIWPEGVIGSITHEGKYAIAAAARKADISLLGIDLASRDSLADDLVPMICGDDEIRDIQRHTPDLERNDPFKLVFSIKESVYKCLFPIVQRVFDFVDVSVRFRYQERRIRAELELKNHLLFSDVDCRLEVAYLYADDYIFTSVWAGAHSAARAPKG